jgi:hypothetical protein
MINLLKKPTPLPVVPWPGPGKVGWIADTDGSVTTVRGLPSPEPTIEERLARLEEKIDDLHRKLDLIFGNAVLVNGRFLDLAEIPGVIETTGGKNR